ncbi:uncharacterized protein LOC115443603 isoform X3 [Manduca sexta]|uniref:Serine/threonine-protein phosphatase n=1 Tax=Manduca sexta TaxID=7130 RepID=A0A921YL03_MANSE|nr:uncharacterized protein LOC115443603 isoform X3 [Manduca sexta]KAG6441115.1 hypothetical protein O3G_MSEX001661 [Manduca sexta]
MFKHYKDICDVVSLLVHCPSEKSYLLTKETNGEFWIPSSKAEKNCWKLTAHKINFELFGMDAGPLCVPLRVYKIWLPNHSLPCVYHAVYKVSIKSEVKKRTKIKSGIRNRLQWFNTVELERQRAHCTLRSPEVAVFALMAAENPPKDQDNSDMESGALIEICEENVIIGADVAGGAVALASPNYQLLQAANYTREDQVRMFREFVLMVYPAIYMSLHVFTQFMIDLGWQRSQCTSLFRAADVTGRGGLSFLELMLWTAALEPTTQHSGIPAEIRCRYIFRYFDSNRDLKLEYVEFKELVAAARAARQLPVDALSVARDADVCLRQLGMQPNSQLPLAEFLRGVGELRLRGTSSLLRAPRSITSYLIDLQERDRELNQLNAPSTSKLLQGVGGGGVGSRADASRMSAGASAGRRAAARPDYSVALHTVRLRRRPPNEMLQLTTFDEDAVSPSTARLITGAANSLDVLGSSSSPVEALAAVHYFATCIDKSSNRRDSGSSSVALGKPAWSWCAAAEEAALGALLWRLAEAVRPLCAAEPRLLRLSSPLYVIGDLHGNLPALLAIEAALWPSGTALAPARLLFLGDYVDRGPHGSELMAYLLAAKLQRPHAVSLIRGNHETRDIQKMFTFYNECVAKYGDVEGGKIWNAINNVFDALPLAAVVDDKVFCCHGGIPPPWVCPLITAIDKVPVPLPRPAEQSSIAWELLWNDPVKPNKMTATLALELAANEGFAANAKRGTGHVFDQNALDRFLLANQLSHVVRAHEMHQNGFMCQLRGRLVSVFSSYHYCGGTNDSGVALLEGGKLRLLRVNAD